MSVSQLGYVGTEASDLGAWERFGADILGLQLAHKSEDRLVFRMDEYEQRIFVTKGRAVALVVSPDRRRLELDLAVLR